VSLALAILSLVSTPESSVAFPEAFHGVWDYNEAACAGDFSVLRIAIGPDGISYWESDGTPVKLYDVASGKGNGGQEFTAELAMQGEGEAWTSITRFVISDDGERLFAESKGDGKTLLGLPGKKTFWFYSRCGETAKMGWDHEKEPEE
jgi:hypothetical protein